MGPSVYSSQECSCCHYINPFNRLLQAEFICKACGTISNADHNGAIINVQRGYMLLSAWNRQTEFLERPKVELKWEAPCESGGSSQRSIEEIMVFWIVK